MKQLIWIPLLAMSLIGCPNKEPVVDADNNMDRCFQQGLIEGQKGWHECLERECRESGGTPEQMGGICWNGRKVGPKSSPWLDRDGDRIPDERDKCPDEHATHQLLVPDKFIGCACPDGQQGLIEREGCVWNYCPDPFKMRAGFYSSDREAVKFCSTVHPLKNLCRRYPLDTNPPGGVRVLWCER